MTWRAGGGWGEMAVETNVHFPQLNLPPFQLNPLRRSSQDLSGTKIGRSLNLNEVCRIGIANSFKFETKSAGNE